MFPGLLAKHSFAYLGAGEAFFFAPFFPENLDLQTEFTKVPELSLAPFVIEGQKKGAVHRDVMMVEVREVDRKGDNGEFGDPEFSLQKSGLNHPVSFEVGQRICRGETAQRVCGVISRETGVRIGDADNHVPASGLAGHEVFQVVIMKDLESSMDNTGVYHQIPRSHEWFYATCFPKDQGPAEGIGMI